MSNFKSLLETGLFVRNLSKARDFYQQVLGLKSSERAKWAACSW
jgi:catechol 2,3-dioxygenase-like lactoylglutathione lyase family enzyme